MLIKESRLRNLIRSVIKESMGSGGGKPFKFGKDALTPPETYDQKPGQQVAPSAYDFSSDYVDEEDEDYDALEADANDEYADYDYDESIEGDEDYSSSLYSPVSVDQAGQDCWDAQRPGSTPREGDECYEGNKIYTWNGEEWKSRTNRGRRY